MFWRICLPKRSQNAQRTAIHSQPPHVSAIGYCFIRNFQSSLAQLKTDQLSVEHCTGMAEVMDSNLVIFSGFNFTIA